MASNGNNQIDVMKMCEEDESFLRVTKVPGGLILGMILKTAIELNLFELMAGAGPDAQLSASQISSLLPTKNPEAPVILDRILRCLATQSYLKCNLTTDENGNVKRLYSLVPVCKALIPNDDGVSLSPLLVIQLDEVFLKTWGQLKDTILEGGMAFERAYGMPTFEYPKTDNRFNGILNKAFHDHTVIAMKKVIEVYNGFDGAKEIVDVGGGIGGSLACILSKYPNIKGINFDLPHVVKDAPFHPGIEHVGGDMFESVPKGEVIFMKWILHDWTDERCVKLLKNCWKALPENGKVIIVDAILPEYPETDVISSIGSFFDMTMLVLTTGGKERTLKEFEALAKAAGFVTVKRVCPIYIYWIIELYKN